MTLEEIRKNWEEGLTVECEIPREKSQGNVLVVLSQQTDMSWGKTPETLYSCHRYFPIGDNWNCSVDAKVTLDMVWPWLQENCSEK